MFGVWTDIIFMKEVMRAPSPLNPTVVIRSIEVRHLPEDRAVPTGRRYSHDPPGSEQHPS